jgi:hypothetical protein
VALTDSEAKTVCAELSAVAILDTAFGVLGAAFSSFSHKGRREEKPHASSFLTHPHVRGI